VITGTSDGKNPFVAEFAGSNWRYDILPDACLRTKRCFVRKSTHEIDAEGNLYLVHRHDTALTVFDNRQTNEHINVPEPWCGKRQLGGRIIKRSSLPQAIALLHSPDRQRRNPGEMIFGSRM